MAVLFLPAREIRNQSPHVLFVADEIVVDDKDGAAPAEGFERVELGENLLIALRARNPPVDFDDVAELAGEGTAARILDGHRAVTLEVRETKIGNWRRGKCRAFGGLIDPLGFSAGQVSNKLRQRLFSFAPKDVVGV